MDRLTPEQRSQNMAKIRSKNTKPEVLIFEELDNRGISYEKHYSAIPGKPDIAFPDKKVAVFINGEFWHGRYFSEYKDKLSDFWYKKISSNIKRDKKNYKLLRDDGWKIVKIWDRGLKKKLKREVRKIIKAIEL